MDSLLASYASDEDDDLEKEEEEEKEERKEEERSILSGVKPSLFERLPPPGAGASSGSFLASLPPPRSLVKSEAAPKAMSGLFAKLPPPGSARSGPNPKDEGLGFGTRPSSLFAALPPPKVEAGSVKVEAGSGNAKGKKQVVAFKPPIDVSVLEEDEDDWRPTQKRVKVEAGGVAKGGGGLQALLPAPKHTLGLGGGGGGRRAAMEIAPRTEDVKAEAAPAVDSVPSEVKEERFASQERVQYDNAAYAVDESAAFAPQYSNEAYGWATSEEEIPQSVHDANCYYEEQPYSSQASSAPVSDPVAQVLQAERRRGREDRMPAPNVIEVKQADLTGDRVREDRLRATGIAFGPAYQPMSSSKDNKPSKLQRRKHQIGSLLHDMRARESELLERRARGHLTKAETQAKYGW